MAFSDYQQSPAWKAALELGPRLTQLAEELPAAEQHGLAAALRSLALDLPTAVAIDAQSGSNTRFAVVIRLQTALELTGRIYQALDIAAAERALSERIDQLTAANLNEPVAPAEPAHEEPVQAPAEIDQPVAQVEPVMPDPGINPDTEGTHISLTPTEQPQP